MAATVEEEIKQQNQSENDTASDSVSDTPSESGSDSQFESLENDNLGSETNLAAANDGEDYADTIVVMGNATVANAQVATAVNMNQKDGDSNLESQSASISEEESLLPSGSYSASASVSAEEKMIQQIKQYVLDNIDSDVSQSSVAGYGQGDAGPPDQKEAGGIG